MTKDIIIALLGIGFMFAVAALLVALAKLQEEKERRWDEISRAAGLENIIEDRTRDISYYHEITCKHTASIIRLTSEKIYLQDRLSSVLCPTNNHVWKDGCCVKCGRAQDAAD